LLYRLVPGFASLRGPSRFFIVAAAALSALAGYELARATTRLSRRLRVAAGALLALACVASAAPRPAPVVAAHLGVHAPPLYRWLARPARFGDDQVFPVTRAPARPWRAELLPRAYARAADTLEGTPTAPLAPACRAGRLLEVTPPPAMLPVPSPIPVRVRFANASP